MDSGITEFLHARYDEEEAAAREEGSVESQGVMWPRGGHFARWNPARVLSGELAAHRRIVDRCEVDGGDLAASVLADLASVYAGHPDYEAACRHLERRH